MPRALRFMVCFWLLNIFPMFAWPVQLPVLVLGEVIEHSLTEGEILRFGLDLKAGDTFDVRAQQKELDLAVRLRGPDGAEVEVVDRLSASVGEESLFRVVDRGGRFTVEVFAAGEKASGALAVRLESRRKATAMDRRLEPYWRSYTKAWALQKTERDQPESLRRALDLYRSTLGAWAANGQPAIEASVRDNMGMCHRLLGELDYAIEAYDDALPFWRRANDRIGEANTWINRSTAESRRARYTEAAAGFRKAVAILEDLGKTKRLARALEGLGRAERELGAWESSEKHLRRAVELCRTLGDASRLVYSINNWAALKLRLGEFEQSFELLAEAEHLARESGNDPVLAAALSNQGMAHLWLGEPREAIAFFRASLTLNRERGDRSSEAAVRSNLGTAYVDLGDLPEAMRNYGASSRIYQELGRPIAEARSRTSLGWTLALQGSYEGALKDLDRAKQLFSTFPGPVPPASLALVREKLGRVLTRLGRLEEGREELRGAERLAKSDRRHLARILLGLGENFEEREEWKAAGDAFERADLLSSEFGDLWTRADALAGRARADRRQGRLVWAQRWVEQALDLVEKARAATGEPLWKASLVASRIDTYSLAVAIAMDRHREEPKAGFDRVAFDFHSRSRSRSLLDQVAGSSPRGQVFGELRSLLREVRASESILEDLAEIQTRQETTHSGRQAVVRNQTRQELKKRDHLLGRIDRIRSEQLVSSGNWQVTRPLGWKEAQKQLDSGVGLIVYVLGEPRSHVFVVTSSSFESHELPGRGDLEEQVEEFRQILIAPSANRGALTLAEYRKLMKSRRDGLKSYLASAQRLGEALMSPFWDRRFAADGKIRHLAVTADGNLQGLPLAALVAPGSKEPLVTTHGVVHLSSISVVAALREERRSASTRKGARPGDRAWPPRSLGIFADPVFSTRDRRFASTEGRSVRPGARSRGYPTEKTYSRLPSTTREATDAAEVFTEEAGAEALKQWYGFDATKEAFLSPEVAELEALILATHAFVEQNPNRSGFLLSLMDTSRRDLDGEVSLQDLWKLELNAGLVVLSACETGLGHSLPGEGILGLVHGFSQARVPRVVASFWPVNDAATAELMARFYQRVWGLGEPAIDALAAAQASMWRDPPRKSERHPYYWSSFGLFGDWR